MYRSYITTQTNLLIYKGRYFIRDIQSMSQTNTYESVIEKKQLDVIERNISNLIITSTNTALYYIKGSILLAEIMPQDIPVQLQLKVSQGSRHKVAYLHHTIKAEDIAMVGNIIVAMESNLERIYDSSKPWLLDQTKNIVLNRYYKEN